MKLNESECSHLFSIINRGISGKTFHLSSELIKDLLNNYNIKIQKTENGYTCFHGHNIGEASVAQTSGESFCLFLKSHGCFIDPSDISGSLKKFCELNFKG